MRHKINDYEVEGRLVVMLRSSVGLLGLEMVFFCRPRGRVSSRVPSYTAVVYVAVIISIRGYIILDPDARIFHISFN